MRHLLSHQDCPLYSDDESAFDCDLSFSNRKNKIRRVCWNSLLSPSPSVFVLFDLLFFIFRLLNHLRIFFFFFSIFIVLVPLGVSTVSRLSRGIRDRAGMLFCSLGSAWLWLCSAALGVLALLRRSCLGVIWRGIIFIFVVIINTFSFFVC